MPKPRTAVSSALAVDAGGDGLGAERLGGVNSASTTARSRSEPGRPRTSAGIEPHWCTGSALSSAKAPSRPNSSSASRPPNSPIRAASERDAARSAARPARARRTPAARRRCRARAERLDEPVREAAVGGRARAERDDERARPPPRRGERVLDARRSTTRTEAEPVGPLESPASGAPGSRGERSRSDRSAAAEVDHGGVRARAPAARERAAQPVGRRMVPRGVRNGARVEQRDGRHGGARGGERRVGVGQQRAGGPVEAVGEAGDAGRRGHARRGAASPTSSAASVPRLRRPAPRAEDRELAAGDARAAVGRAEPLAQRARRRRDSPGRAVASVASDDDRARPVVAPREAGLAVERGEGPRGRKSRELVGRSGIQATEGPARALSSYSRPFAGAGSRRRRTTIWAPVARPPRPRLHMDLSWTLSCPTVSPERVSAPAGLCDSCRHQIVVRNTRGSAFSLCRLSRTDRTTRSTRACRCSRAAATSRSAEAMAQPSQILVMLRDALLDGSSSGRAWTSPHIASAACSAVSGVARARISSTSASSSRSIFSSAVPSPSAGNGMPWRWSSQAPLTMAKRLRSAMASDIVRREDTRTGGVARIV